MFIGRQEELKELNRLMNFKFLAKEGFLVGVDGRRRVGKTSFVDHFCKNKNGIFLNFIGNLEMNSQQNVSGCYLKLKDILKENKLKITIPKLKRPSWVNFFLALESVVKELRKIDQTVFIFFDEVTWYDSKGSFLAHFANCWNSFLFNSEKTVVFLASSVSSWMSKKVFGNVNALYNRISLKIDLKPFSIFEIKQYLHSFNPRMKIDDVISYYLMFGGIIKYYEKIDYFASFEQNLKNFSMDRFRNYILKEKQVLFSGLFSNGYTAKRFDEGSNISSILYERIMMALAKKRSATAQEIFSHIANDFDNLTIQQVYDNLNNLVLNHLIIATKTKNKIFTISDQFCYFLYYWLDNNFPISQIHYQDQFYSAWKGIAFEII